MQIVKIKKIEEIEENFDTYNLEVEDNHNYFANGILVSNCHLAAAKSLNTLSESCINAQYRIGLTGTFPDDDTANYFSIVGSFGPVKKYSTYKELQKRGYIANLKIYSIILNYPQEIRKQFHEESLKEKKNGDLEKDYNGEVEFINGLEMRNKFLIRFLKNLDKNILILFTRVETHGKIIFELVKETFPEKQILYIDGSVKSFERNDIREVLEKNNNVILVASYGTFSTGANVKNIQHIICASSYKSKVKILQSIGRGLRVHSEKKLLYVHDLVDNMFYKDGSEIKKNYSLNHYEEKKRIYEVEEFDNKEIIIELTN